MSTIKSRIQKLEVKTKDEEIIVWIDWGGPTVEIKGETMTREEMERRYPDRINVGYDDQRED